MEFREAQQAMQQWLNQVPSSEQQLDRRWIGRYRDLTSQDSFWWLSWAGPFTEEEQQQWDRFFRPPMDEATKSQLAPLLKKSRERELEAALAAQREPRLHYPAIEIDEVRHRITELTQLRIQIEREEPNRIVRQLYQGAIENDLDFLRMIEATYEHNTEQYWHCNKRMFHEPTQDEMNYAFAWVRRLIQQGLERPETAEVSQQLIAFLRDKLHVPLDVSTGKDDPPVAYAYPPAEKPRTISAEAVKQFYSTILREYGFEGWQVVVDYSGNGTRVESGLRQVLLAEEAWTLENIRIFLAHELAGHVARSFAGEHSPIGLLGLGTRGYSATEEGLALYYEREVEALHGKPFDNSGLITGMLATGLASGIVTPPQTFWSLYTFFERLIFLYRRLLRPWRDWQSDQNRARKFALTRCLRTYRGMPDLNQRGFCYLQDVTYLRGLLLVEHAVSQEKHVLDQLAVGKIAYDLLPVVQSLEIIPPPQPLRKLIYDPGLDTYILAFEAHIKATEKTA
ncbi:MAG TPA: tyrosine/phenylalanine carboxypeptidase domain-containing protein [Ktedonobacteraceae bacterium]|nr:tyrosine/phenylalanine carboxypeptidase domain-containing protein [Ktedonobacteraceae bacterium]